MADPALLYLGSAPEDRLESLWGPNRGRTLATVLGVLSLAALVTWLAARRLVRPVLTLTDAARRMRAGDTTARVPVNGHDEVAQLGGAFNAMAESLEATGRQRKAMVSDIAHELRSPLTTIRGYLEAAQDGIVAVDADLVESLLEEAAVLGRLVDDLQDLALADAGRLQLHSELVDAATLAEAVASAHRAAATAARIRLEVDAAEPVPVHVDPARLRQTLGNLVGNALRYTPPGGTVSIGVREVDGSVALTVHDTGIGIAAENLPHIFDRFYRADASRNRETGGSGLGLAIAKHLVEAHGGAIQVDSLEGRGSTFTIRLPAPESSKSSIPLAPSTDLTAHR